MPRKKEKIISLEVMEPNSTWDYSQSKILNNFICRADDAEKVIIDMDPKEVWKHERAYSKEVKAILSAPGTRNASSVFFNDDVNVEEVKLPKTIKGGVKYIYKIYDYSDEKINTEYGTQKDVLAYISKKIKTKYAVTTYNGVTSKIEYSPKTVMDILNQLEKTTSQFQIESTSRSGDTSTSIFVTCFRNCLS